MRDRRGGADTTDYGFAEDLCTIVSLGGISNTDYGSSFFTLPPYSSVTAGFALIGGTDSLEAVKNAVNAQRKWFGLGNPIDIPADLPEEVPIAPAFSLNQNYPNPFNPSTKMEYSVAEKGFVVIKIYNLAGQEVSALVSGEKQPGRYSVLWDAAGRPGGVYFAKMSVTGRFSGSAIKSIKLLVIK